MWHVTCFADQDKPNKMITRTIAKQAPLPHIVCTDRYGQVVKKISKEYLISNRIKSFNKEILYKRNLKLLQKETVIWTI